MSTRRAAIRSAAITTVGLLFGSAEGIADSICNSHYRFEDIGALAVEKMNDHGDVVGYTFDLSLFIPRAFSKERDGSVRPLGDLGGADGSIAWDINNSRKVVGTASAKSGTFHAFLWDPKHPVMHDLGALGGLKRPAWRWASMSGDRSSDRAAIPMRTRVRSCGLPSRVQCEI